MIDKNILDELFIHPESCIGDMDNNEYVNILIKDVIFDPLTNDILQFVKQSMGKQKWVFQVFKKSQIKLLNTICKTEANKKALLKKRLLHFYDNLLNQYQSMAILLNKDKIDNWGKICKKYGVEL